MARNFITCATEFAWGYTTPNGDKQIAVRMPAGDYAELKARAVRERRSMNAVLLDYVQTGLAVDRDWDEDVPDRYATNKITGGDA